MKYIFISFSFIFILSCTFDNQKQYSSNKNDVLSSHLIHPQDANSLLQSELPVLCIQVSTKEDFMTAHIPGASNLWRPDYADDLNYPYGGMRASGSKINQLFNRLGVNDETTLLLYDSKGNVDAHRFAWVLESYGFRNYKLIRGGLAFWEQSNLPISTGLSHVIYRRSNFLLYPYEDKSTLATFDEVRNSINDPNTILVDTREPYEYLAQAFIKNGELFEYKKGAFERGCIPGAVHLNWSDLVDLSGDNRIKSLKDLHYNLDNAGITADKNIIVYCHSGSRSSHTAFVLREILKFPSVKNYDGSWIEWSYNYVNNKNVDIQKLTEESEFQIILDSLGNEIKNEKQYEQ